MRRTIVTLSIFTATLLATTRIANAAPISIDFNTDLNFEQAGGATSTNESGEPTNAVGLQLPGQVGPWEDLTVGNGDTSDIYTAQRQATVGSVTFTFNPGGADDYKTFDDGGADDLRSSVVFLQTSGTSTPTGTSVAWSLTGLTVGGIYDLILFGEGVATTEADFSITGHDAGNGTSNPVTLDSEDDGNFTNVIAVGGTISGTFAIDGTVSSWAGLQFEQVRLPEPSTVVLAAFGLVGLFARRRRRR